ncbi:MAG TPA: phosphatidylglycerophosphatase A [Phycisphaerae bacterium]|nr:phosphatidylglycerophosphatase A [Phycisphaerae bacterium]
MSDEPLSSESRGPQPIGCWRGMLVRVFGTSFGLGYIPLAPGTWGTLPAVAFFLAVMVWVPAWLRTWVLAAGLVASAAASVPLGFWAERHWGQDDPPRFALDEFAGFLLTVLLFRLGALVPLTLWAFALTRLMDILKIPPAYQCQKLPGGWGILLDDLVSSLYAAGALHLLFRAFPKMF